MLPVCMLPVRYSTCDYADYAIFVCFGKQTDHRGKVLFFCPRFKLIIRSKHGATTAFKFNTDLRSRQGEGSDEDPKKIDDFMITFKDIC